MLNGGWFGSITIILSNTNYLLTLKNSHSMACENEVSDFSASNFLPKILTGWNELLSN